MTYYTYLLFQEAVSKSGKCQNVFDSNVSEFHKTLKTFLKKTVDTQVTILQFTLGLIKKVGHQIYDISPNDDFDYMLISNILLCSN